MQCYHRVVTNKSGEEWAARGGGGGCVCCCCCCCEPVTWKACGRRVCDTLNRSVKYSPSAVSGVRDRSVSSTGSASGVPPRPFSGSTSICRTTHSVYHHSAHSPPVLCFQLEIDLTECAYRIPLILRSQIPKQGWIQGQDEGMHATNSWHCNVSKCSGPTYLFAYWELSYCKLQETWLWGMQKCLALGGGRSRPSPHQGTGPAKGSTFIPEWLSPTPTYTNDFWNLCPPVTE